MPSTAETLKFMEKIRSSVAIMFFISVFYERIVKIILFYEEE